MSSALGIVIVTYHSAGVLAGCLDALGPDLLGNSIVVDNASSDGSSALARARGVRVLARRSNEGFARAANEGAAEVGGEVLAFLNPDARAGPETFAAAATLLGAPGGVACAAPTILERGRRIEGRQWGYTRLKLVADVFESSWGLPTVARAASRFPGYHDRSWSWAHGACLCVRRDAFESVGGFAPEYFMYMEDVDFGRRLSARGMQVATLPVAIFHAGAAGAAISNTRHEDLLAAGRILYANRHYGARFAVFLARLSAAGLTGRRSLRAAS